LFFEEFAEKPNDLASTSGPAVPNHTIIFFILVAVRTHALTVVYEATTVWTSRGF
jgi:hypothetical protein